MTGYSHDFFANHLAGSASSAEVIVPMIRELVRCDTVVDVGCGVGTWLAAFLRTGSGVEDVLGLDGPWVRGEDLLIPRDRFAPIDLVSGSLPGPARRKFDLAVSVEVAEHLPEPAADGFVAMLTGLAPVVVFSAAIPGQGGTGHLNEQWPRYWADKFAARGYMCIDAIRMRVWDDPRVRWWYAQNLLVFCCNDALAAQPALNAMASKVGSPVALVHPRCFEKRVRDSAKTRMPKALRSLRKHVADRGSYRTMGGYLRSRYSHLMRRLPRLPWPLRGHVVRIGHAKLDGDLFVRLGTSDFPVVDDLLSSGEYDPAIRTAANRVGGAGNVGLVVDLGANIGVATRMFRREFPRARVIAVEPDAGNFAMLERNIASAPTPESIKAVRACAVGVPRTVSLDRSGESWGFRISDGAGGGEKESIPGLSIPDLLAAAGVDADSSIDLLKCDIEGAESELFAHCAAWIGRVRVLAVELHHPYVVSNFREHLQAALGSAASARITMLRDEHAIQVVMVEILPTDQSRHSA